VCGIAGKICLDAPIPHELLDAMCGSLVHRGPDSRGHFHEPGVALGIQRLAVIDLETGDQPIANEDDSVVVVCNGEIYNYVELREELQSRGHRFRTQGDTETIVHLYEEHGDSCVDHLRGMFAFALWDRRARRLLLGRDRVGKKPLFYRVTPQALWFASEPRAILADAEVPRTVDYDAIDSYLRFQYVPAPRSAFKEISKLPPAHVLSWQGGSPDVTRYWELDYRSTRRPSFQDASEQVRELLLEATRLRLRADVSLGAFLSGGVDSSAVVAAMAKSGADRIKTFSIGFDEAGYDETSFARSVAERYDTDHEEFHVRPDAIAALPRLVWHYGEPFADSSALPSFYLAELTRRQVTVALNGDGGDESFAGYDRYRAQLYVEKLDLVPQRVRRATAEIARRAGPGGRSRSVRSRLVRATGAVAAEPATRYEQWMSIFSRSELDRIYAPGHQARITDVAASDGLIVGAWESARASTSVERMLAVDLETYLPGDLLVKMDVATMAHSLEVRSPFLDHVLMEQVASLPGDFKLGRGAPKRLLKEAVRPWLPDAVIDRRKMGFGVPLADWFRGSLRALPETILLDPRATERGIFSPDRVRRLIEDHRAGASDNASRLWALIQLELWFETYIDQLSSEPITL
jgi:asparagine synthase (glutamine-hydrolysing)